MQQQVNERYAGISIDVDSVQTHLQGYGIPYSGSSSAVYQTALPRILEVLAELGAKATFFFVAEECAQHKASIREVAELGHEIACHSGTHELPFSLNDAQRRKREIGDSKALLEDLCGQRVCGFRAPSWDLSEELIASLIEYSYKYDASAYPSWAALALRLAVKMRSANGHAPQVALPRLRSLFAPRRPHVLKRAPGTIVELPVSCCPLLRLPYYHTLAFLLPAPAFSAIERMTLAERGPVNYIMHGVDFLDLNDRGVPEELKRHPGMNQPLSRKLQTAAERLRSLTRTRDIATLETIAAGVVKP